VNKDALRQALKCYHRGLALLEHKLETFSSSQLLKVDELRVALHLNCAQIWWDSNKWEKVIVHCNQALNLDPHSPKGLFRRAIAYHQMHEFKAAIRDLNTLLIDTTLPRVEKCRANKLLQALKIDEKKQQQLEKKCCKLMLKGLGTDET